MQATSSSGSQAAARVYNSFDGKYEKTNDEKRSLYYSFRSSGNVSEFSFRPFCDTAKDCSGQVTTFWNWLHPLTVSTRASCHPTISGLEQSCWISSIGPVARGRGRAGSALRDLRQARECLLLHEKMEKLSDKLKKMQQRPAWQRQIGFGPSRAVPESPSG